jgi:uncharacterized protein YcnI
MQKKPYLVMLFALTAASSLSAHVMVSPPESKSGAVQKYEVRVHNESKLATTSVDLDLPDGVMVTDVAKPAVGSVTTKKNGDRIVQITWQVDVQPSKYLALPFTAKNPQAGTELRWTLHQHLSDGSVVDWSDKPGSREKGPVTKLVAPTQ